MNAWHCGVSMTENTCRTWSSCMHMTVIGMWQNLRPQDIIEKYTHVQHKNCESTLVILYKACCTQAGPAHSAGHVEIAWTDDSTLAIFWHRCNQKRLESSGFNTSTVSQAAKINSIDRLPCSYLCCSSQWIGKSMSCLHPCCCHWGGRLFTYGSWLQAHFE